MQVHDVHSVASLRGVEEARGEDGAGEGGESVVVPPVVAIRRQYWIGGIGGREKEETIGRGHEAGRVGCGFLVVEGVRVGLGAENYRVAGGRREDLIGRRRHC